MDKLSPSWPTFHDLMVAYKSCRLNKSGSSSQIQFELRLGENLSRLHNEIQNGTYRPSPAKCFVVMHPKPREIFAAEFRDRVVHHLIVARLEPCWERNFIYSTFACRKGKGSHCAIKYLQSQVRRISKGGNVPVWALQLDIAKFFVTIDRNILCQLILEESPAHPLLRQLIRIIFMHDARLGVKTCGNPSEFIFIPDDKRWFNQQSFQGIPIGNLSSQLGANIYLSKLDHYIQRVLKPAAYLRYVDDLLLLGTDSESLARMIHPIDEWIRNHRKQELNMKKTHLINLSRGTIRYLGYRLKQTDLGSEPLQVYPEPLKKFRLIESLMELEKISYSWPTRPHPLAPFYHKKELSQKIGSFNSKLGSFHHCRSYIFRKGSLDRLVEKTMDPVGIPDEFCDPWQTYKVKQGYRSIKLR